MFSNKEKIIKKDVQDAEKLKNHNLTINFRDELGDFSSNINTAINDLRRNMTEYYFQSQGLMENSQVLYKSFADASSVFEDTNKKVRNFKEDMQSYANEISDLKTMFDKFENIINDSFKNIEDINKTVESIDTSVKSSLEVFAEMIELVEESFNIMNNVSEDMNSLKQDAESINNIINVVRSISYQTSLLSLNASIEAARTGEAGKGFAVVANEIGKLSTQTQESVKNIESTLTSMQEKTASMSDNIIERTEDLNKKMQKSKESIAPIYEIATEVEKANKSMESMVKGSDISYEFQNSMLKNSNKMMTKIEDIVKFSDDINDSFNLYEEKSATIYRSIKDNIEKVKKINDSIGGYSESVSLSEENIKNIEKATDTLKNIQDKSYYLIKENRNDANSKLRKIVSENPYITLISVLDTEGYITTTSIKEEGLNEFYDMDFSAREWFKKAMENETYVSSPYLSINTYSYAIAISLPIIDEKGDILGVIMCDAEI